MIDSSGPIKVFVYGTLKRGKRNEHFLETAVFLKTTLTKQTAFSMVDLRSKQEPGSTYPAVLENGKFKIKGELYHVDESLLRVIDNLEDEGVRYKRVSTQLESDEEAIMYINVDPAIDPLQNSPHLIFDEEANTISWE